MKRKAKNKSDNVAFYTDHKSMAERKKIVKASISL